MSAGTNGARVETRGYCQRCHRPLRDPASVARGIGPDCAAQAAQLGSGGFRSRAGFDVVKVSDTAVWIADQDAGLLSVTNDAANVVAELLAAYPGRRIFYRDTIGRWDELAHQAGRFAGFRPGAPTP